ncbi:Nucleotide-diphospho-sugar transferase domain-containing protein [Caenorhabditis elegans]|uniref:Nucleotide-diphospho-sugar transferase domain-containing protein n=2 Tax=Caenorhabditis elegans TaxID=6239 RepID=Q18207_CAEEL|nr:Nucleotide-diphospho-sugar transferase domain-containing protein [Caenorhabditis elegans]CAA96597.2 Nucleotide-diphospho-sugar transferase domain-containing protein [Caenorhabditis elegans]|eukprot:NP_001040638.2 Uncharacterized protein CELE_C26C6.4 [Caenorhabditis elegans]
MHYIEKKKKNIWWPKKSFSFSVLVVLFIFVVAAALPFTFGILSPHILRQRNIVVTVNRVSKELSFEDIHNEYNFMQFSEQLKAMPKPPYIIFYDSSNLDIFLNHICNLEFIPGALSRLVAISFDTPSHLILKEKYPNIPSVVINLDSIKKTLPESYENRRYIIYQLVLLTRARICASLALRGISFWAMQQDTLWVENFDSMDLENRYPDEYMLFDTVGNEQFGEYDRMFGWICGSTFFVRGNPTTYQFFYQIDSFMRSHQSPDSSIMTYLCGHRNYRCHRLPRWIISSSDYFRGTRETTPVMIQVDSDQTDETKMESFQRANFIFRHDNGTCDRKSVHKLRDAVRLAFPEKLKLLDQSPYGESMFTQLHYMYKHIFNIDRYNNKVFLTVHYTLV